MSAHALSGTTIFRLTAVGCAATLLATSSLPLVTPGAFESDAAAVGQQLTVERIDDRAEYDVFSPMPAVQEDSGETVENDADGEVQFPVTENVSLTDGFGYRTAPVAQFHDAQDFAAPAGTPVRAIADGSVVETGYTDDGCGFGLRLEHEIDGQEVTSRYCHMELGSHTLVEGDSVSVGEQVGRVGNTGMSFGPHLHLVVQIEGESVDPMPFLTKHNRK